MSPKGKFAMTELSGPCDVQSTKLRSHGIGLRREGLFNQSTYQNDTSTLQMYTTLYTAKGPLIVSRNITLNYALLSWLIPRTALEKPLRQGITGWFSIKANREAQKSKGLLADDWLSTKW